MAVGLAHASAVAFFFRLQALQIATKIGKGESLLAIESSFSFSPKVFPESRENPQPQNTADGAAAANPPSSAIGYLRSKIEPIAGRPESENSRGGRRYKYAGPEKHYEVTL